MRVRTIIFLLFCTSGSSAFSQGFAGLGTDIDGFSTPTRGVPLVFPKDHGAHPDYRIEWWYVTANMTGPDGTDYGLQWTLFRSALAPEGGAGWSTPQIWMGHAAVTTPTDHYVSERLARGGIGQAGVTADPFEAWIDEWQMSGDFDALTLTAAAPEFAYDVSLSAQGPLVAQGDQGYSIKSAEGQASYYYSQPFFALKGTLTLPSGDVPVTGTAWLDREWSSQPLSETQTGWDWFSLSFDDGSRMMGFVLRQTDGEDYTSATWIAADGTPTAYEDGALRATPIEVFEADGRALPVVWRIELPDQGVNVRIDAVNNQSWMTTLVPYWEGPVRLSGSHEGRGYLEMTGYE